MQNKTMLRFGLTTVRMASIRRANKRWGGWVRRGASPSAGGNIVGLSVEVPQIIKIEFAHNPAISLLGIRWRNLSQPTSEIPAH